MKQTHQKTMGEKRKSSKSFKAPTEKGLTTTHDSLGAAFIRKKPLPRKKLEEEYEDGITRK